MTSSDFGYLARDKEENRRRRQAEDIPRVERNTINYLGDLYRPTTPPRQGPLQRQTRFDLSEDAPASSQYFDDIDFINASMLPQVYEALGESGRDSVINEIRGRRRAETRRAMRDEPEINYEERILPRETQFTGFDERIPGGAQLAIPGLRYQIDDSNEAIRELRGRVNVKRVEDLIEKYPELERVLRNPAENLGQVATRIDPKSFDRYKQYTDLAQTYSDPADRAKVYTNILEDLYDYDDEYSADAARAYADVKRAEELYTSGDARNQETAREILRDYGEDLSQVERSAFQPDKPIIGGGGYVTPRESEDIKYINRRADDFSRALTGLDYRTKALLEDQFPGLRRDGSNVETERTYFSPTEYVEGVDDVDSFEPGEGTRVSVQRGVNMPGLQDFTDLPDDAEVSQNVVRFLKENPGLTPTSVAFKVAEPGSDDFSYDAQDLPDDIKRPLMRFVQEASMADRREGTILNNSPIGNQDLLQKAYDEGLDEKTSSYLRQAQPFVEASVQAPSIRGKAYTLSGYGPTDQFNDQYTYISKEGKAIPLQITRPERPLVGSVNIFEDLAEGKPAAPYKSQPRFYSTLVPGVTPDAINNLDLSGLAKNVRKVPASLAPGAADLIPSAQSVRIGYEQGPVAMGQNMAREFVQGIPVSAAAIPILAGPAAPLAPGIGAGLIGSAIVEAGDEVVRQETGEGILPKVRQFLGTESRTGVADELTPTPVEVVTPEITATKKQSPIERITNGIRFRTDLAGERFNPRRGEFGLSELIFGR